MSKSQAHNRKTFQVTLFSLFFLASLFNAVSAAWLDAAWTNRKEIVIQSSQVDADLTDFPVYVDLSDLNDGGNFFSTVQSDGRDIRITTSDGETEVPFELVAIDTSGSTGELHFKATGTLSSSANTTFYIYYGNSGATAYGATDTYGSENVWTNSYAGVWHLNEDPDTGTAFDSTSNSNDGTHNNMTGEDPVAGKVGQTLDFDGSNEFINVGDPASLNITGDQTISFWSRTDGFTTRRNPVAKAYGGEFAITIETAGNINYYCGGTSGADSSPYNTSFDSSVMSAGTWYHLVHTRDDTGSAFNFEWFRDGSSSATASSSSYPASSGSNNFLIADGYVSPYDGELDEVRVANTVRSDEWISTAYNNQNSPSTFYSIGADEDAPPSSVTWYNASWLNRIKVTVLASQVASALTNFPVYLNLRSLGNGASWYSGSWSHRKAITIQASQVDADLTDFPVYVDLSDLNDGGNFFSTVKSDGSDIRITTADGTTELPYELVSINTGGSTGELHFKVTGTLSSSTDTTFYIYYGNASATAYAETDTYGAQNVWTNNYEAVWHMEEDPSGSAPQLLDSTSNSVDATSSGSMTTGDLVSGHMTNAIDMDGGDDYFNITSTTIDNLPGTNDLTISAWVYQHAAGAYETPMAWASDFLIMAPNQSTSSIRLYRQGNTRINVATGATLNSWHYFTYRSSSATNHVIDADGGTWTGTSTANLTSSHGQFYIGSYSNTSGAIDGLLDELRVSSVARDATWISTEYNNQNSPSTFYSVASDETPDLSHFFDTVKSLGEDIRMTTGDGVTEIPFELVSIYPSAQNGELHFKAPSISASVDTDFYIYYNNPAATAYAVTDTYGAENVWTNNYLAVYHLNEDPSSSNVLDSTSSSYDGTSAGSMTTSDSIAVGRVGKSIDFDGTDDALDIGTSLSTDFSGQSFSFSAWDKRGTNTTNDFVIGRDVSGPTQQHLHIGYRASDEHTLGFWGDDLNSTGTHTSETWRYWYSTYDTGTNTQRLYLDGSLDNSRTAGADVTGTGVRYYLARAAGTDYYDGELDEIRFASVVRSADWIASEYTNQNTPDTFYTTAAKEDFEEEEPPPSSCDDTAWYDCAWQYRKAITVQSSQVDADLTDYPVYVDLSDLTGDNFFENLKVDGSDIRITTSDGKTELPYEIVSVDTGSNGGELHFKATGTLSSSTDTTYYIYYGNSSATAYTESDTYGSQNVWTNDYLAVWHMEEDPSGSAPQLQDSTSREIDGTSVGSMTTGDLVAGKFSNAMDMDGSGDYFNITDTTIDNLPGTNDFTISAWVYQHTAAAYDTPMAWASDYLILAPNQSAGTCQVYRSGGTFSVAFTSLNSWHYFTYRSTSSTNHIIDIDGGATTTSSSTNWTSSHGEFYIGSYQNASGSIDGLLDELRVSGVARAATWISTEYNNQNSPSTFYSIGTHEEVPPAEEVVEENPAWLTDWTYRIPLTIAVSQVNGSHTGFPVYIDLNQVASSNFFSEVEASGADIRITTSNGLGLVPFEVVDVDTAAKTGEVHFKAATVNGGETFYLYYGNSGASALAETDTYGAQNVWTNNYIAVFHMNEDPSGTVFDSTANSFDASSSGSMGSADLVTGKVGDAIDFDGSDDELQFTPSTYSTDNTVTITAWANYDAVDNYDAIISSRQGGGSRSLHPSSGTAYVYSWDDDAAEWSASTGLSTSASTWHYYALALTASDAYLVLDGASYTNTETHALQTISTTWTIGEDDNTGTRWFDGRIDELRFSDATRSAGWIDTQYNNQFSPATFFGYGDFEINPTAHPWFDTDWTKRILITVKSDFVNGDLTDFPVYIDLGLLNGTDLFTSAQSNGSDLRMTKTDGTQLATEIVNFDNGTGDGELHFLANGTLSGSIDTNFYLYYANPTAALPAESSTWGAQNVWANHSAVWHMQEDPATGIQDSTANSYDGTATGTVTQVSGHMGNASDFDGSNDYVSFGDIAEFDVMEKFTYSTWFKRETDLNDATNHNAENVLIAQSSTAANDNFEVGTDGSSVDIYVDGGPNLTQSASASIAADTWHKITVSFDSTLASDETKLYVDGFLVQSWSDTTADLDSSDTSPLTMGIARPVGDAWGDFDGLIDFTYITNGVVMSPEWIWTEYQNQRYPGAFIGFSSPEENADIELVTSVPTDNGTVSGDFINNNMSFSFNVQADFQTGDIYIKRQSDDSTAQIIDVTDSSVSGNGSNILTIDTNFLLNYSTNYYIEMDAGIVNSIYGDSFAGINGTTTLNFRTSTWLEGFDYRIAITTNGNDIKSNLTDFPLYFDLNLLDGTDFFDDIQSNGSDLRVTDATGDTEIPFELVNVDTSGNGGELHLKASSLTSGTASTFYIYYGNGNAAAYDNGDTYGSDNLWSNSYVAVWHMDEDPSAGAKSILDSSGSDYHADPNGTMTAGDLVTGQMGNALDFDSGTSDYLDIDSFTENFTTGLTISAWVDHDAMNNWSRVMDFGNSSANNNILLANSGATTNVGFEVYTGGSSGGSIITAGWNTSAWQKVDATIAVGNSAAVYMDGSSIGTGTINLPSTVTRTLNYIGRSNWGADAYLDARVDELRIATLARSAEWIETEYHNQSDNTGFWTVATVESNNPPTEVLSFIPPDNGFATSLDQNFVINFNAPVDIQTGNIEIRHASNGGLFDTIDVATAGLTGNGTSIIGFTASSTLSIGTGYYVQIDATAFSNYVGISNATTWNFTTAHWLEGFNYRIPITNNGNDIQSNLTDFPLYLDLNLLDGTNFFDQVHSSGSDIRITDSTGNGELAFELVELDTSSNGGEIHFKASSLTSGTASTFYIYYGNGDATAYDNGDSFGSDNVWTNNYEAVYHMDDNPDSFNAIDSTSNDRFGTYAGPMNSGNVVTGQLGSAIDFDGSADFIDTNYTFVTGSNQRTVSTWFNADAFDTGFDDAIYMQYSTTAGARFLIALEDSAVSIGFDSHRVITPKATLSTGTWYYINTVVPSGATTTSQVLVYIDGTNQALTDEAGSSQTLNTDVVDAFFGARNGTTEFSDTRLDEMRISSVARSAGWILTEYHNQSDNPGFWSIGTTEENVTSISVVSFIPPDNGTAASVTADLQVKFDGVPTVNNGNVIIKHQTDDTVFLTLDTNNGNVFSVTANNLDIMLPSPLYYNTDYYVEIDSNAINNFAGFTDNGTWNFNSGPMLYDINFFDKMF